MLGHAVLVGSLPQSPLQKKGHQSVAPHCVIIYPSMSRGDGCHVYPRVAGARPPSRSDWRNSKIFGTEQCTGSSALSEHHAVNSCHLFSCCARVEGALAFSMVLQTSSEHSVSSGLGPAAARPIAVGNEGRDARSCPVTVTGDPSCREGAVVNCCRACAAVETMFSLARRGLPTAVCDPAGGPSVASEISEGLVERHRGDPLANRGREHPDPEGCSPLSRRTTGGNGSTPLWQRDPPLPCRRRPRC